MIDIVICDDSRKEREKYREQLVSLGKKYGIPFCMKTFVSGKKLLDVAKAGGFKADIIYLDIHMPEMDGVSVAEQLRELGCMAEIIFLTVSDHHQLPAFDVEAFNYIIKDVCSEERFSKVFLRAIEKAEEKNRECVCFTGGGESRTICIDKINYFETARRIVTVHYGDGETFEFHSSMEKLESQLAIRGFLRVHRSFIVSIKQIYALTYREMKLQDGTVIPVGRSYYNNIKTVLQREYGIAL